MEILIKSYEYRFYPAGHVYKAKIETLEGLKELFYIFKSDDWKRAGQACFKTPYDNEWLEYNEFVLKYFSHQLRPTVTYNLDLIGFEDSNGRFKSYEELQTEIEEELAENKAIEMEEYYEELISNIE